MDNQMNLFLLFFFFLCSLCLNFLFKESLCVVLLYSGVGLSSALGASL